MDVLEVYTRDVKDSAEELKKAAAALAALTIEGVCQSWWSFVFWCLVFSRFGD